MTIEELEAWQEEFERFHARFADLFERSESREQAKKYLRGLLAQADRKNSWQVAEAVGDRIPDRMQRLLYRVPWNADAARDQLLQFVIDTFGDEEGIGVVDETSFVKKGTHSVGVARQYLGTAGKLENGQVATVLSYAARGAHMFLDRRLYLPEEWTWDKQRRAQARVPEQVRFETKPEQAIAMLVHAWEQGVPMRWVTGDECYVDSPRLRETIQTHGRFYAAFGFSQHPRVDREARGHRTARADGRATAARPATGSRRSIRTPCVRGSSELAQPCLETLGGGRRRKRVDRISLGTKASGGKSRSASWTGCLAAGSSLPLRSQANGLLPGLCASQNLIGDVGQGCFSSLHGRAVHRGSQGRDGVG